MNPMLMALNVVKNAVESAKKEEDHYLLDKAEEEKRDKSIGLIIKSNLKKEKKKKEDLEFQEQKQKNDNQNSI